MAAPSAKPLRPVVSLVPDAVRVEFERPAELKRVSVETAGGMLLAELPAAGRRRFFELPFEWQPATRYRMEVAWSEGSQELTLESPAVVPPLRASLELPFGQDGVSFDHTPLVEPVGDGDARVSASHVSPESTYPILVPAGGTLQLGLLVECTRQAPSQFELELHLPPQVTARSSDPRVQINNSRLVFSGRLALQHDYAQTLIDVSVAQGGTPQLLARLRQWSPGAGEALRQDLAIELHPALRETLADLVELVDVSFPANPDGQPRPEQQADTVVLADEVWSRVRQLFRPSSTLFNYYEPYAWQAVSLANRSEMVLNLRLQSEVDDAETGEPLLDFSPPAWKSPVESASSEHLVRLAPGETAVATIPLYVRPEVLPGEYRRRFQVFLLGSRQPLFRAERTLRVVRGDAVVSGVVLASLCGAVLAWLLALGWGRKVVDRIGVEGLTTIGLLAGVHFVVAYAFRLGSDILAGVLGPFYIFVAGIGNEGAAALMLAVVVTLVPRVGTASLSIATVFLLNSMFTGQFGFVELLFASVACMLNEGLLASLGVTTTKRLRRPAHRAPLLVIARVALAIGTAKGLTLYTQLCLVQVLYRLYYADWYMLAAALWVGLGYASLGAGVGTLLGYQLRRTAR